MQPIQQHGRRLPSINSSRTRLMCSRLVSDLLTEITQQIHSFRASGVRSSHAAFAFEEELINFFKSAGNLCIINHLKAKAIKMIVSAFRTTKIRMNNDFDGTAAGLIKI